MLLTAKPGHFIVVEGPEGCGKSTQLKLVAQWLRQTGREVVVTHEPGGTDWGARCRQLLLDGEVESSPLAEFLAFESSRAQHVIEVIRSALTSQAIVLCDRFSPSSIVYQSYAASDPISLEAALLIDKVTCQGVLPSLCLVLWLSAEDGLARAEARRQEGGDFNVFDARALEFHQRVAEGYRRFSEDNPLDYPRIEVIDARPDKETVFAAVKAEIEKILPPVGG